MGYPSKTTDLIMDEATHAIKGNHDISVLEWNEGHVVSEKLSDFELQLNKTELTDEQINWITNLGPMKKVPDEGLIIAHAKPEIASASGTDNGGITKGRYTSVASNIDSDLYNFVILGHTHNQAQLNCERFGHDITIMNPGSVGQPIGKPAEYAIIDTEENTVELKSVEYNYDEVVKQLESLDVPIKWWI